MMINAIVGWLPLAERSFILNTVTASAESVDEPDESSSISTHRVEVASSRLSFPLADSTV